MFLSLLNVDTGDNRPGRTWLRNLYHVHQRLCMAFPSADRKSHDKDFLQPFKPDDFGNGQVHVRRQADSGFLFRIDPLPSGRAAILVQSAIEPDWGYAFHNAGYLLAAPPEWKPFDPGFTVGQRLRFRLVANPMKKVDTIKKEIRERSTSEQLKEIKGRHGRRVPVPDDKLCEWLIRRAEGAGFVIDEKSTTVQTTYIYFKKSDKKQKDSAEDKQKDEKSRLRSVRYDGVLEVTDADKFRDALICGIGSGKAFGFGLLSVALHVEAK